MDPITEAAVLTAMRSVIDPELGVNVVDLGLVYGAEIDGRNVRVAMTMTTPACPLSSYLKGAAEGAVRSQVPEVGEVVIDIVWEPPWQPTMMSDAAKRQLGWRE